MRVRGTSVGSPKLKPSEDNWGDDDWGDAKGGGGGGWDDDDDGWGGGNDWDNPPAPPPSVAKAASHVPQRASALSSARRDAPGGVAGGGGGGGGGSCSSSDRDRDSMKPLNTAARPAGRRLPVRLICLLGALVLITMQSASRAPSARELEKLAAANQPLGDAAN